MTVSDFLKLPGNDSLNDKTFGRFLRQRREELGKTVRGLAAELDLTPAYVCDIEKGNRYAPIKFLEKIRIAMFLPDNEIQMFNDLASASRGNTYEDINPYLGKSSLARVALRKARDLDISDEQWKDFIQRIEAVPAQN